MSALMTISRRHRKNRLTRTINLAKFGQQPLTPVRRENKILQILTRFSITAYVFVFLCGFTFFTPSWSAINKQIKKEFPDVAHVTVEQLSEMIGSSNLLLVDVRTREEYAVSTIKGAQNYETTEEIAVSRGQVIVVFCSVGYRSARIADELRKRGRSEVYNLRGSLFDWANKGFPLFQGKRQTFYVHPFNKHWGTLLKKELHRYSTILDTQEARE